jgi:hypothetical protein
VPNDNGRGFGVPNGNGTGFGVPNGSRTAFGVPNDSKTSFGVPNGNGTGFGVPNRSRIVLSSNIPVSPSFYHFTSMQYTFVHYLRCVILAILTASLNNLLKSLAAYQSNEILLWQVTKFGPHKTESKHPTSKKNEA